LRLVSAAQELVAVIFQTSRLAGCILEIVGGLFEQNVLVGGSLAFVVNSAIAGRICRAAGSACPDQVGEGACLMDYDQQYERPLVCIMAGIIPLLSGFPAARPSLAACRRLIPIH
jgi:hypothetical protein